MLSNLQKQTILALLRSNKNYENKYWFSYKDFLIETLLKTDETQRIFNEPEDIFPSDIQRMPDYTEHIFIVGENGNLITVENLSHYNDSIYFCWWD